MILLGKISLGKARLKTNVSGQERILSGASYRPLGSAFALCGHC